MKNVKVDRVSSVAEVETLQRLGVNAISISLSSDRKFKDRRTLSKKEAYLIKDKIEKNTSFIGSLSINSYQEMIELATDLEFDYIQLSSIQQSKILPNEVYQELKIQGIGLIYSDLECSYDTDPSWILRSIHNSDFDFAQIDLLGDIGDSWNFLKEKCPNFTDELQVSDINDIARENPLLITTDLSENNLEEIIDCLANIKGIAFVLGDNPIRDDFHYFSYCEVIKMLEQVNLR